MSFQIPIILGQTHLFIDVQSKGNFFKINVCWPTNIFSTGNHTSGAYLAYYLLPLRSVELSCTLEAPYYCKKRKRKCLSYKQAHIALNACFGYNWPT